MLYSPPWEFLVTFLATFSEVSMAMRCVKCGHDQVVKNGSVQGVPKHRCKVCGYQFTKNTVHDYQKYPLRIKLLAVWLYLSGLSMRRISRLCQCSTQSVLNWVREYARAHYEKPAPEGHAVILEVDEMWHYLKKSPENCGSGKLLIGIQDACLTGNVGLEINVPSRNCISA
jgi:transposase